MKRIVSGDAESDPLFDLPLENELLILKLKAEFGTECTKGIEDIPPEVVNEFLQSVYEFEHKFREPRPLISIYEKTGKPLFRKADAVPEKEIHAELKKVRELLNRHQLELDILGQYPDRQIYKFITEEFLYHQMDDLDMKGYVHHFCYEDFHPNYELEIRQRATEFVTQWFGRRSAEFNWQLADPFIHPDSREFPKETVLKKIRDLFDSYQVFSNCDYKIDNITFEWDEVQQTGRGFVNGKVAYDAITERGDVMQYRGPFEIYLSNSGTWWSIFYFVFPGFAWK